LREIDDRLSAGKRPVIRHGHRRDAPQQLGMTAGRHVRFRQGERCIDRGGAVSALAKQGDKAIEWRAVAWQVLDGLKLDQAEGFECSNPNRRPGAHSLPWAGAAGKIDAQEARLAHGAK
jgi:hypothetical protein